MDHVYSLMDNEQSAVQLFDVKNGYFTIEEICQILHITPSKLQELFKSFRTTNKTEWRAILKRRREFIFNMDQSKHATTFSEETMSDKIKESF